MFLQKPAIRQVGDKIVLECKLTADPKPLVSWILNNQPISFGPGSRLTSKLWSEGSTHTLTLEIAQVSMSDAGEYKAYAKNDLGEATATITLNFEGEGREIARRWKSRLQPFKKNFFYPSTIASLRGMSQMREEEKRKRTACPDFAPNQDPFLTPAWLWALPAYFKTQV